VTGKGEEEKRNQKKKKESLGIPCRKLSREGEKKKRLLHKECAIERQGSSLKRYQERRKREKKKTPEKKGGDAREGGTL